MKFVLTPVLFIVLALVFGVVIPRPFHSQPIVAGSARILVLSNPIHTDIAIPVSADLLKRFAFLKADGLLAEASGAQYIVFGWGGRSFYTETPTWADLKFWPAFRSLTIDRSVLHVELTGDFNLPQEGVLPLEVSPDGMTSLLSFIEASFTRGPNGPVVLSGFSYGLNDLFYEANGSFNALVGCNTWTAAALHRAGFVTGAWTPLPPLLTRSLSLHNEPRRRQGRYAAPK
nr:TIGR02117 family protein [Rhizobium sp. CFBP 8762]